MSYPIPQNTMNTMATPTVYTTNNTSGVYVNPISSGSSGQYLYSNGTGPAWNDTITISTHQTPTTLQVKGDADFEGEVKIKGINIGDTLAKLEERLAILHPNEKLEEKWEKLKELRKQYQELEADILEKEKIMEILKR